MSDLATSAPSRPSADAAFHHDDPGLALKRHSILRANLSAGFSSLTSSRRLSSAGGAPPSSSIVPGGVVGPSAQAATLSSVTVNFIDPTTNATPSPAPSSQQPRNKFSPLGAKSYHQQHRQPLDLYHRLTTIFTRDYSASLKSVPYSNIRTGQPETIYELPIRFFLTGTPASGAVVDASTPWGGTAGLGHTSPVSDPAEWHVGPYCHVYIAACESLDHYRSKVRPALQAFVSQIEGPSSDGDGKKGKKGGSDDSHHDAAGSRDAANREAGGNYSSQYLIVYVPTGPTDGGGSYMSLGGGGGGGGGMPGYDNSANERGRKGLAGRVAAARRQMASGGGEGDLASSMQSALDDDGSHASQDPAAAPPPGPIVHSSKNEKELYRKFNADFPNGRTCILSTLLESTSPSTAAATSPLKNQEWNAFLRNLGGAIVAGFKDRCRRYDEELRRLDSKRAGVGTSSGGGTSTSATQKFDLSHFFLVKESLAFTYEQMQLPSEALLQYEELEAFVPESSWRHDDDDAYGDDIADDYDGLMKKRNSTKRAASTTNLMQTGLSSADLAAAGDTTGFRRRIRATTDLTNVSHLVMQYLFARESSLLFKMGKPVEVIRRAHVFVRTLYNMRLLGARAPPKTRSSRTLRDDVAEEKVMTRKLAEAEAWALTTCWDVKCSTDSYFSFGGRSGSIRASGGGVDGITSASSPRPSSRGGTVTSGLGATDLLVKMSMTEDDHAPKEVADEQAREASMQLSEVLSFARIRLLKLGDTELGYDNPIRAAGVDRPADTRVPWVPWEELPKGRKETPMIGERTLLSAAEEEGGSGKEEKEDEKDPLYAARTGTAEPNEDDDAPPAELDHSHFDTSGGMADEVSDGGPGLTTKSGISAKYLSSWLRGAFSSREAFERKYLELSGSIITLNRRAGRHRFAARLQGERAEVLILRGEYREAVRTLLPIADGYAQDQWDRAHYWRLFRLACCQRMTGDALDYLDTLTRCFDPHLSFVAPAKTSNLLQSDLEAVVGEAEVSQCRLGVSPFLETELVVEATKTGKSSHPLGYLRKKVVKYFCSVGETMRVALAVTSHLPRPIDVDGIRVFLVTFDHYETVHRSKRVLVESDAFRILSLPGPLRVEPGQNVYKFDWVPMTVGQYILSTAEIKWKQASFTHDSATMRRPIMGIDVIPSDPTQTIELNPLFLIPGHVQQVRLVFQSGSDIVTEGAVELICSEGLKVCPPGVDPDVDGRDAWRDSCSVPLRPCAPGEKQVLTTSVKSASVKRDDGGRAGLEMQIQQKYKRQQQQSSLPGAIQTMHAKVITSYHHALYKNLVDEGDEPESPPMTTLLEAMVTTLDRPALSVDTSDAFFYAEDRVMVTVALHCNTPVPFYLKEWNVRLPPPLVVSPDGDLNKGLFGHPVSEGEEFFFGFQCERSDDVIDDDQSHITVGSSAQVSIDTPILHVILKDEFGKTFRQVLPLDLDDFYGEIRRDDEYSAMNSATAELTCNPSEEGCVGAPVNFTYSLDVSTLTTLKRRMSSGHLSSPMRAGADDPSAAVLPPLLYSISCDDTDWILAGKVQGILNPDTGGNNDGNRKSFRLDFVGIPTRSGVLKRFPKIGLRYHGSTSPLIRSSSSGGGGAAVTSGGSSGLSSPSSPPITVHFRHPQSFKSLSYTHHMALACPAMVDV